MLSREELAARISSEIEENMSLTYDILAWSYPVITENTYAADMEKFGIAEHSVKRFFSRPIIHDSSEGAMQIFCRILSFDNTDIKVAVQRTKQDLKSNIAPEEEVAVTAVFLWFQQASLLHGTYDLEFKYLGYVLADALRGDSELKESGAQKMAQVLMRDGNFFEGLASFCRKVLLRH